MKVCSLLEKHISFFLLKEAGGISTEEMSGVVSGSSTFKPDVILDKTAGIIEDAVNKETVENTVNEASKENAVLGSMSKDEPTAQPAGTGEEGEDTIFTDE